MNKEVDVRIDVVRVLGDRVELKLRVRGETVWHYVDNIVLRVGDILRFFDGQEKNSVGSGGSPLRIDQWFIEMRTVPIGDEVHEQVLDTPV